MPLSLTTCPGEASVPTRAAYTSLACLPLMVPSSTSRSSSATCRGATGNEASSPRSVVSASTSAWMKLATLLASPPRRARVSSKKAATRG